MSNIYIKRLAEKSLKMAINQFPVVLITGARQAGKSTLLKENFPNYRYISLDIPSIRQLANEDPNLFFSTYKSPLIIDEIQYAPNLLVYIKNIIDQARHIYGQFLLTGSQSFQLMKNVSESLAGRIAILELYPFCMQEIKTQYNDFLVDDDTILLNQIIQGFYPEFFVNTNLDKDLWFSSYISTYIERDVRNIKNITNLTRFQTFINLLANRAGTVLNMSEISKECGITQPTCKDWLSILESTYIIYRQRPFYANLSKRFVKSPKIYFVDTGLLCFLLGLDSTERLLKAGERGHLFENFVVMDLLKKYSHEHKNANFYYYRTQSGLEVDLIIEKNRTLFPFEIKFSKTINKKITKSLLSFCKEYNCASAKLISLQKELLPISDEVTAVHWSQILFENAT